MTREELLRKLADVYEGRSEHQAHVEAEELLLTYIDDPQVTELWHDLADDWWYA